MQRMPGGRVPWALGAGAAIAAIAVLAALLGAWPFGERALSREELIARGDEACARAQEEFAELQREPPRSAREAAEVTETLIDVAEDELDEIAAMTPPAGIRDLFDRYLAAVERGIEIMRSGLEAAEAGDADRYEAAQARLERTQRRPRTRLAREIGFQRCSRPLDIG